IANVEKYTRYPIVEDGDKDKVIGLVNIKEIYNDIVFNEKDGTNTVQIRSTLIVKIFQNV
ncbi:hypothetical protein ABWL24_21975, partial [Priestia megaterium]